MENKNIGKYCIFRGNRSGVFAGTLDKQDGSIVTITGCRRLWYWEGACSDFEIALIGTTKPDDCKFTVTVDEITITDCIEIIPATAEAEKVIKAVDEWKSRK